MSQLVSPRSTANTGDGPLRNRVVALTTNNLTPWLTNPPFSDNTQFYGMPLCYHQMPLKGEWHSWAIDQPSPLHGLPMYFSGSCYGAWSSENGFPIKEEPFTGDYTACFPASCHVSPHHLYPPSAGVVYPASAAPSRDSAWGHSQGITPPPVVNGHYSLYGDTSGLWETGHRPREGLRNPSLTPMADRNLSSSSELYPLPDMTEAMELGAVEGEPRQSPWKPPEGLPGYGLRCVEITESDTTSSPRSEPETDGSNLRTVSPHILCNRQTPSPASSPESLQTSFLSESGFSQSPVVNGPMLESNRPLPDADPIPSPAGNVKGTNKSRRRLPNQGQRQNIRYHPLTSDLLFPGRKLSRLRPKPKRHGPSSAPPKPQKKQHPVVELRDAAAKDQFLIDQKKLGLTYKEIRKMGQFSEAESTLRGRYRTLTKPREERVRKPEWSENDDHLLEIAVSTLSLAPEDLSKTHKIPWKKVAEYIFKNGGSYHFGNSTCCKRWAQLMGETT